MLFALQAFCNENPLLTGGFLLQITSNEDIWFHFVLHLKKQLNKQNSQITGHLSCQDAYGISM